MSSIDRFINLTSQLTEEQAKTLVKTFYERREVSAIDADKYRPNHCNLEYKWIENILTDYGLPIETLEPEDFIGFVNFVVDSLSTL